MRQPTQRDLQAENRRMQLLDIALKLFAERGVENVSIKDLATEANVAQGLVYYYFESKEKLLAAVFERNNPLPEFQAIAEQLVDLPAREGLMLFAEQLARLLAEKRPVLRLLVRELLSPRSTMLTEVVSFRKDVIALMAAYLQRRVDAGELRPHQPLITIHLLVSSLLILMLLDQPLEPFVAQLVDTVVDGIRVR